MRNAAFLFFLICSALVQARVYRWVDESGKVQYSDQPPPAAEAKPVVQLDSRGLIRSTPAPKLSASEIAQRNLEQRRVIEQQRHDRALSQSFSKPEEIDRLRDGQIDAVNARMQTTKLRLEAAKEKLKRLQQQEVNLKNRKKPLPVPDDLKDEQSATRAEIAALELDLKQLETEFRQVIERSEADKKRLLELQGHKPPTPVASKP